MEKTADNLNSQEAVPVMVGFLGEINSSSQTMKVAKIVAEMAKAGKWKFPFWFYEILFIKDFMCRCVKCLVLHGCID